MTFELTPNELKAALFLVQGCLKGMGGDRPIDLDSDPYTWVYVDTLQKNGWSKAQAAGTFSALDAKGLICEYEPKEWILTDAAYRWIDTVWDENKHLIGA